MNRCVLYVGTRDGIRTLRVNDTDSVEIEQTATELTGNAVRAIAPLSGDPTSVFVGCGLRGWGLHYSEDGGESFSTRGFDDEWVWCVTFAPDDPRTVYVGTEPPMMYVSRDGGDSFDSLDGVTDLPSWSEWTFFHEPFEAGHIHGLSIHPERPDQLVAGVEHGALVYSRDGGETWAEALVGKDLHRTAIDPTDPNRWFAGAGEGLFVSEDAGTTWRAIEALSGKYVHSIRFDPRELHRAYVYVAQDSAPVYRSVDRGATWQVIGDGLPSARPADPLCLHPDDPSTLFYAGDVSASESRLFVSTDGGTTWTRSATTIPKVWRMEAAALSTPTSV